MQSFELIISLDPLIFKKFLEHFCDLFFGLRFTIAIYEFSFKKFQNILQFLGN